MKRLDRIIFKNAPRILLGAFFLCCSCEEKATPEEPSAQKPGPVENSTPVKKPGNVIQKIPAESTEAAAETGE
ncbi:MAG TPA: hypothetical protein DIV46_00570, partial [Verrucomicrobiales bacterium]|nr:hypothetical protein [Verrucomicrobiales bacterium]